MIRAYENRWFPLIRSAIKALLTWGGTLGGAWLISFKKLKQVKQRNAVLLADAAGAPKISEAPFVRAWGRATSTSRTNEDAEEPDEMVKKKFVICLAKMSDKPPYPKAWTRTTVPNMAAQLEVLAKTLESMPAELQGHRADPRYSMGLVCAYIIYPYHRNYMKVPNWNYMRLPHFVGK